MSFEPTTPDAEAPAAAAPPTTQPPKPDPETGLFVNPTELPSFIKVQEIVAKARQAAEAVPEQITDESQLAGLQEALATCKHAREDVERARKDEKRPYEQTGKRLDASYNELKSAMLAIEESVKERLVDFDNERQEAAERKRQAEVDAARKRQEEADAEAAKTGAVARTHRPPPPKVQPTGARSGLGKSSVRKVRKWRVTDVNALPEEYVDRVPNKAACAAAAKAGEVVPGLEFYDEPVVATR
jgi:hypothetical protein